MEFEGKLASREKIKLSQCSFSSKKVTIPKLSYYNNKGILYQVQKMYIQEANFEQKCVISSYDF